MKYIVFPAVGALIGLAVFTALTILGFYIESFVKFAWVSMDWELLRALMCIFVISGIVLGVLQAIWGKPS